MKEPVCTQCQLEMEQIEKTTFSGRDMREYQCPNCKRTEIIDCGIALWKALSDAKEPTTKNNVNRHPKLRSLLEALGTAVRAILFTFTQCDCFIPKNRR